SPREADLYRKLLAYRNAEKRYAMNSPFFDGLIALDEFDLEFAVESEEEFVATIRTLSPSEREHLEQELDRGFFESQARLIAVCRARLQEQFPITDSRKTD